MAHPFSENDEFFGRMCHVASTGVMPWHAVRFLNEASERVLLQAVGGGYRFIHPLFQQYFASLHITAPSTDIQ